jgi:lambda repressor-like predicted transcriptional regulator
VSRVESHVHIDPERLLAALAVRGLSTAEAGRRFGISGPTLSAVLAHRRPMSARTARKLGAGLLATPVLDGLAAVLTDVELAS